PRERRGRSCFPYVSGGICRRLRGWRERRRILDLLLFLRHGGGDSPGAVQYHPGRSPQDLLHRPALSGRRDDTRHLLSVRADVIVRLAARRSLAPDAHVSDDRVDDSDGEQRALPDAATRWLPHGQRTTGPHAG